MVPYTGQSVKLAQGKLRWFRPTRAETRPRRAPVKFPPVGNMVDSSVPTWTNDIGQAELQMVWTGPDFDPAEPAF